MCVLRRFSHVLFFASPCTVAHQAAQSVGFSRQKYQVGCHALLQGIFLICVSNRTYVSWLLHWQAGSLPLVQPGKPMDYCPQPFFSGRNTGVGSVSLLQGIFPTQGSNPGLLYCRQILYQLNHQGSPFTSLFDANKNSSWDIVEEYLAPRVPDQQVHSQLGHL